MHCFSICDVSRAIGLLGIAAGFSACAVSQAQVPAAAPQAAPVAPSPDRPKKIYAHYMGCYPAASGPTAYHREHDPVVMRHDGKLQFDSMGDRWRNFPLAPEGLTLTTKESVDLEIRRAMRIGVDGFTIDAWAGGEGAQKVMDAMFEVAEEKDYPFEITITLDMDHAEAIRYLLDHHGNSPKLARRDGKPLIFGYLSVFNSFPLAAEALKQTPEFKDVDVKSLHNDPRLRATPEGWRRLAEGYKKRVQADIKTPLYIEYCIGAFFANVQGPQIPDDRIIDVAEVMAGEFPALGMFLDDIPRDNPRLAKLIAATNARGAEWMQPIYYQYENVNWGGNRFENGTDKLRGNWKAVRDSGSRLLQFITWNDYTENTNLAPGTETRYAMYDLNGYFIQWWKTGQQPAADHDRLYLTYRKYPQGAKFFPFKAKQPDTGGMLEVLSILPTPGRIRLPGRSEEFDAPAGLSFRQFPLTPGPVSAELLRDGKVVLELKSPEPITDRPFREQNSMVSISSEFMRHWKADFGDAKPCLRGEYADDDGDGLPNWFEMYWYGKFLDYSTATAAKPDEDPHHTGKSNLQHYLDQTDPTKPVAAGPDAKK